MKLFRIAAFGLFSIISFSVSAQVTWSQLGVDIEGGAGDGLGSTLSMSADGTIVAAGAPSADAGGSEGALRGQVKVYVLESGSWTQMGSTINGTEDGASFGAAISISDDGTLLAIGAPHSASTFGEFTNSGQVKIYSWNAVSSDWDLEETIEAEAAGDNFGYAISVAGDGSVIAIGAPVNAAGGDSRGTVRVYDWDGALLTGREDLDGAADFDGFGAAVGLNLDGSVLAVGASSKSGSGGELNVGQVTTYSWNTTNYDNTGTLDGIAEFDSFGDEVSLSDDGTRLAVSVTKFFGGVTYVELFDFSSSWSSVGVINSANDTDGFGNSINLSGDGSHIAIGANSNVTGSEGGRAEVYAYTGAAWEKVDVDITGDEAGDGAGTAVSISANGVFVAVGAPNNVAGGVNAGQVKVFEQVVPDLSAPTVTITSDQSEFTKNSPFGITITFSEEVTGFIVGDIAVTNGAAGNFATSDNISFTADITPIVDGTVTVNIAADVAQDLGSNANAAANEFSIVYDATAPTVAIDALTTNDQTPALTGTIDDNTATISVTVGEETHEPTKNGDGTWTLPDNTLSSLAEAEYTVSAIATDALGNQSDEVTALLKIDLTGPQIYFDNGNLTGVASFTDPVSISPLIVNIFFSEEATGLTLGEITIDGNVGTTGLSEAVESGVNFYILAIPLQNSNIDQQITITIPAGAATDLAGNPNLEGSLTISYDVTGPSVSSVSTVGQSTTNATPIAVEIVFDEEITALTTDDFTVGNGTIAGTPSSEDNITFTLQITPTNEGLVTIQLLTDAVEDLAGNLNALDSDLLEMTYDITKPVVEISTQSAATATSPIIATVTFSEAIDQLTTGNFTVTNGTATSITTVDVGIYTLEVTPDAPAEGSTSTAGIEVTIALEAGKVQDAAGNGNTAANTLTVDFDDQPPVFNLFNDASEPLTAVNGNFTANFTITESASAFDIDVINVTNGTKSNFRSETVFGFTRYRVDIALTGSEGVTITIPAGAVTDGAGNANIETTFSIGVDNVGPTVTISSSAGSVTNVNPIPVTFTFSEKVSRFIIDDIATNNFSVTSAPVSEDNITFTTEISPSANGALTIALKEASVQDITGNNLTNTGSLVITFDDTAPTVAISGPDGVNSTEAFQLTFTFSENVEGFTMEDIAVADGTMANFSGTDAVYTVAITPDGAGTVTVSVAENVVTDAAGNPNAAGAQKSVSFDATRPTVAITGAPASSVNNKNPITFTFTFSEVVTGFALEDITVTNGTKANFTGSGAVYTADISPAEPGDVAISLVENIAVDAASNGNEAASVAFTYEQKYSGGSGTEADPYKIATEADLRDISSYYEDYSSYFIQTADIDMSADSYTPIGDFSRPFRGNYNGHGYRIRGLQNLNAAIILMYGDVTIKGTGLFGVVTNAVLTNISLTSVSIILDDNILQAGGLVALNYGEASDRGLIIENCFVSGYLSGNSGQSIAGIVCMSFPTKLTMKRCFSDVTIEGYVSEVSGLAGFISSDTPEITDSYSLGLLSSSFSSFSDSDVIGGLVGYIGSSKISLKNTYFAGTIVADKLAFKEALIGFESSRNLEVVRSYVTNSFFDKDLLALGTVGGGGVDLTTAEMYNKKTYTDAGWDFENTWSHSFGYPILKWQIERHNKPFKVSGKILDENGNPFTNGLVNAFSWTAGSHSVTPGTDGSFTLDLPAGSYVLSVFPTDVNAYERTYLGNTNRLDRAKPVFYDNIYTIRMVTKPQTNLLTGNGQVSGKVVKSAGGARIVQGRVLEGDPLEGVAVMLVRTSDEQVMTTVETDANGDFEITGIPAGEYQLVLGVAGLDLNLEGSTFTMDEAGTPLVISAAVGEEGVTFAIEEVLGVEDEIALSIFPNPVQNQVNVLGKGQLTVRLLSLSGDVLKQIEFIDKISLDISSYAHGVYLLEITNNSQQRTVRRLIKSD
ncbi:MAG: Ig-like domain-containing protein [Imperialibacter sp.]|uniref:Ig-like domain-containing protein n=1 Tax=Imperialibacter sp. TaxID=2038411 RepID=UPI0032EDB2A8